MPCTLLVGMALLAQDPFPRADADPEGTVVDERGAPIAGATVEILGDFPADSLFARATAQILWRTPLPATRTDRDGHFVLPIADEQRALGAWMGSGDAELWLVVRADGHLIWREPLSTGLRGYFGSRVVLPTVAAAGEFAAAPWPPIVHGSATDIPSTASSAFAVLREPRPLARRPAAANPPGSRGERHLIVRVHDEQGHPVARAPLLLANPFFLAAAIAERPAVTDEYGRFAVDDLPAEALTSFEVQIAAVDHPFGAPLDRKVDQAADRTVIDLTVASDPPQRYLTVDERGHPVPFTPVLAEYGGRNVLRTVLSDSCGRMQLPVRADNPVFEGWRYHGATPHRLQDGVWYLTVRPQVGVLVRTEPCNEAGASFFSKDASGGLGHIKVEPPGTAWFLYYHANPGDSATLSPKTGPAFQIAFGDLRVQTLGGFPVALVDLRIGAAPAKK